MLTNSEIQIQHYLSYWTLFRIVWMRCRCLWTYCSGCWPHCLPGSFWDLIAFIERNSVVKPSFSYLIWLQRLSSCLFLLRLQHCYSDPLHSADSSMHFTIDLNWKHEGVVLNAESEDARLTKKWINEIKRDRLGRPAVHKGRTDKSLTYFGPWKWSKGLDLLERDRSIHLDVAPKC